MSTSLSLPRSSRVTDFSSSRDEESVTLSPDELRHLHGRHPGEPRRIGRVVLMVIIALAMQAGIVWQLHRSAAARRDQVAMEMRDFEQRAQALRAEMSTLQDRIGQTREQLGTLDARSAPGQAPGPGVEPRIESRPGNRPARPGKPATARPQPSRRQPAPPAQIVLTPACRDTPLGC